jgi:hypothetical protein
MKMSHMAAYFEKLNRETNMPETEVMAHAIESGLKQLWREHTLGRFLRGKLGRNEAIELVDIDWVELAERQRVAMMEDLNWALL